MTDASDIKHLTEFEADETIGNLSDRDSGDTVEFDPFYDGHVVNPWARGPRTRPSN